jgi:hypothetical protein
MKIKRFKITVFVIFLLFSQNLFSQSEPPSDLTGSTLRTWLKTNWYNGYYNQLGYDNAREQMYGYVDRKPDGQIYCVYSQFHQASEYVTYPDPINAEHTIPQSWFSQNEPMRGDLFHLYPTHQDVNNARGDLKFAEIGDGYTDKWYIVNSGNTGLTVLTSIPTSNIDEYSELNTGTSFEPREEHKGDVARSAFYFYTMYPTQAGVITNLCDLNTLYQWHLQDPVDAWELQRNNRIEIKQGNRNPYIDYPEIACRAWDLTCVSDISENENIESISIYPNPVSDQLNIEFYLPENSKVTIEVYDIVGRKSITIMEETELSGFQNIEWNIASNSEFIFQNGIYFINLKTENSSVFKKIIYNK